MSSISGRSNVPPSRHLWVGNLSHYIAEQELTYHFLRFGELENVAFHPGRSYAFINFSNEEDAIAALKALQGFPVNGNSLRVEFAKAEKSSMASQDEDRHLAVRGSPYSQRDAGPRHASPETLNANKSKMKEKNGEPSEVLWIGFPALLKVDEATLRKAFSPFGEIGKITVFPGRSYAFVQFRNVLSACRAKETLQGKLFGNPRVHICFSRSENSVKGSTDGSLSPHSRINGRLGSSERFLQDRNFSGLTEETKIRSPNKPNYDSGDSDVYGFKRKGSSWSGENSAYEPQRFEQVEYDSWLPEDVYEQQRSPMRFRDFPPKKFPQKSSFYGEPWDMTEDTYSVHGSKKLKTSSFPLEKELPEYTLSDLEREKCAFPRIISNISQSDSYDKNHDAGTICYKQNLDLSVKAMPHAQRNDHWKPSYDGFQAGSGSLSSNLIDRKRYPPELSQPSAKEWKWEGTIAKGGNPVCRARCFPVGKVLDIMLPEFLDCTARTGLDMLARHYYQASSAWVVFFVPGSDADMEFYHEFRHYLEEKQRAAVAKLDDRTTLFLVPPSDFSVKVLKVPGKLSISGVILRLELPGSSFGAVPPNVNEDATLFHGDSLSRRPGSLPSMASYPEFSKPGSSNHSFQASVAKSALPMQFSGSAQDVANSADLYNDNGSEKSFYLHNSHDLQASVSVGRNTPQFSSGAAPSQAAHNSITNYAGSAIQLIPRHRNSYPQEMKSSMPYSSSLQPEQLAQLASSLLGLQRLAGSAPNMLATEAFQQKNSADQQLDMLRQLEGYTLQNNQVTPELSASHFTQMQQFQQQLTPNVPSSVQREFQSGTQINRQLQSTSNQEEAGDSDPQKRLEATLQLAAALLQQIQQGKGT